MQYRLSFILMTIGAVAISAAEFLGLRLYFDHVPTIGGWTLNEVMILFGLSGMTFAIAESMATGFEQLPNLLVQGTFDRILARPRGAFFQVIATGIGVRRFSRVTGYLLVLIYGLTAAGVSPTPGNAGIAIPAVASGVAIYFSIFVIGSAYAFWTVQGTEVVNIFTNGGSFVASYPIDIFPGWLRQVVVSLVPVAFVAYFPTLLLLDRAMPFGWPDWLRWTSPIAALACALIAQLAWRAGTRRYASAGS